MLDVKRRGQYKKTKLIYGFGVNDSPMPVMTTVDGKRAKCQFYSTWHSMIKRCYDPIEHRNYPNYIGCTVFEDWKHFSNFKNWMLSQDWQGKQLDKDLLVKGNKHYSPSTCIFIDGRTNAFLTDRKRSRGEFPVGVNQNKGQPNYRAFCNDPYTNMRVHIGMFPTVELAHDAWKQQKHFYACKLAEEYTDERIKNALRNFYLS